MIWGDPFFPQINFFYLTIKKIIMKVFNPHQKDMFRYCLKHNNPFLFVDMRLRKSLVTIRWINAIFTNANILIVSPYSAIYGWINQITDEDFDGFYIHIKGTKAQRIKLLDIHYHKRPLGLCWFLINPEFTRPDTRLTEKEKRRLKYSGKLNISQLAKNIQSLHWDCIVFDECTYLRNHKTMLTKYFLKYFDHVPHKAALTGTPAPEGEHEYFTMTKCIEPRVFYETSFYEFEQNHFLILPNNARWLRPIGRDYITERLSKYCYFLSRDEIGLGGEIIREVRTLHMPGKMRRMYHQLEKDFLLEIEDKVLTTVFSTTKYIWMRRLCGGLFENELIDKQKFNLIKDLLNGELKGQQIIIWCHFIDEILALQKFLSKYKFICDVIYGDIKPDDREQRRIEFQKGNTQIEVCQPACFRFGVDFSAAQTMIYHSLPNSFLTYNQSESRPIDLDKNDSILVLHLLYEDSVDFDIHYSLDKKESKKIMIKNIVKFIQRRQGVLR